jgi:hypothetical protein
MSGGPGLTASLAWSGAGEPYFQLTTDGQAAQAPPVFVRPRTALARWCMSQSVAPLPACVCMAQVLQAAHCALVAAFAGALQQRELPVVSAVARANWRTTAHPKAQHASHASTCAA